LRKVNLQRIRKSDSYTTGEIAEMCGVTTGTVLRWIKIGLQRIDDSFPFQVYGEDLFSFLNKEQKSRKRPCTPNEFYCCKCRVPQRPAGQIVTIAKVNAHMATLRAHCEVCTAQTYKFVASRNLGFFLNLFKPETTSQQDLPQSSVPVVNTHSRVGGNHE